MMKDGRRLGTAALATGTLGISMSAVLNKTALASGMHPVWLNVLRVGLAALVMLPFFLGKPGAARALAGISRRERLLTFAAGAMLAAHFVSWAAALQYADSVVVATIWSTYSLMTVIGSSLLLKERTPLPALLGIVLAVAGVGVLMVGAGGPQPLGVVMALCAAITQAVYTLCGRVARRRMDMLPYTMGVYTVALCCLLLCALALRLPPAGITRASAGSALLLALLCTLGGHSMQNYALKYYKAPTVSTVMLTEVVTGPLLVLIFLGEAPKPASLIGGAVIVSGVAWYMAYEWRHSTP